MIAWLSPYRPGFVTALVYMLQATEYQVRPYLAWFWRTRDFGRVMQRRQLERTSAARWLLWSLRAGMALQLSLGLGLAILWFWQNLAIGWQLGLVLVVSYPIVWAYAVAVPLLVGRWLIVGPRHRRLVRQTANIFANHPATRIAVLGSYGKTTMKELLQTVLGEGLTVAATPANRNVSVSHAQFARNLRGDEQVLVLEYGEGRPGDIGRFARHTAPSHAIITGLAPAHLDRYKTLDAAAADLFSIDQYVAPEHVYVNSESADMHGRIPKGLRKFNRTTALHWKIEAVTVSATGTTFRIRKGARRIELASGLLGRHTVAPLALAAGLGLQLGLTEEQVVAGVAKTRPFEHRMQPRDVNGALVIDDTYNGNLEGVRAGTELLAELPAKRKWYVTPGLVEQGRDTAKVHHQLGELVAAAKPDIVVLMANSVQAFIAAGLHVGGYRGEIRVEANPLEFYTTLPHFVAAGDVVLLQNDWTDNYH